MITILVKLGKMASLGLLKIKLLWNNGSDVIIPVHDVADKILSYDSNYIVNVVMQPKVTLAFLWEKLS